MGFRLDTEQISFASWFGVGTALSTELNSDPQQIELLRVLHQDGHFQNLISKVEMTLSRLI